MTKYYCDYCDVFLTHDAPSVRKDHITGWKHRATVTTYFQTVCNQEKMARAVGEIIKEYEERREFVPIPVPVQSKYSQQQQPVVGPAGGPMPALMRPGMPHMPMPMNQQMGHPMMPPPPHMMMMQPGMPPLMPGMPYNRNMPPFMPPVMPGMPPNMAHVHPNMPGMPPNMAHMQTSMHNMPPNMAHMPPHPHSMYAPNIPPPQNNSYNK